MDHWGPLVTMLDHLGPASCDMPWPMADTNRLWEDRRALTGRIRPKLQGFPPFEPVTPCGIHQENLLFVVDSIMRHAEKESETVVLNSDLNLAT